MKKPVQILSVKQNTIVCKVASKKNLLLMPICLLSILAFIICFSFGGEGVKDFAYVMGRIYNPVNSLYNDSSSIVFTNASLLEKDALDFVLPMAGANVELQNNGDINLTVIKSIMVKSCEGGVVEDVGTSIDGIRFIKIRHCADVYSVVENLDMIGVSPKDIVKRGQDIATAKEGNVITLKIFNGDTQVSNLKINQSKIVWEK